MRAQPPNEDAGFTLVEVVVALALMALISLAALTVLTSLVQTNERTAGAVESLSRLQRGLFLLTRDFDEAQEVAFDGALVTLKRPGGREAPVLTVQYRFSAGILTRQVGGGGGGSGARPQRILTNLKDLRWRFLNADRSWRDRWSVVEGQPQAVELTLVTPDGPHKRLVSVRRIFTPPATP